MFSEFERWDTMDKANNMRWTTVWMPPGLFCLAHSGVIFQYGGIHIIPAGEVMNTGWSEKERHKKKHQQHAGYHMLVIYYSQHWPHKSRYHEILKILPTVRLARPKVLTQISKDLPSAARHFSALLRWRAKCQCWASSERGEVWWF